MAFQDETVLEKNVGAVLIGACYAPSRSIGG